MRSGASGEHGIVVEFDRRSPVGRELVDLFLSSPGPLCFEELMSAVHDGEVRDVSAWLGHALEIGFLEEVGDEQGRRCFRLRARGRRILSAEKRGRRRRRVAA